MTKKKAKKAKKAETKKAKAMRSGPKPARTARPPARKPRRSYDALIAELKGRLAEIRDLAGAAAVLSWDEATYMPPGGMARTASEAASTSSRDHAAGGVNRSRLCWDSKDIAFSHVIAGYSPRRSSARLLHSPRRRA